MACTDIYEFNEENIHESVKEALANTEIKFVDVHNYLVVNLPSGDMIVDATWPATSEPFGTVVNKEFILGQSQQIACEPIKTWVVPEDRDPQAFKDELLHANFTEEELIHRDKIIRLINQLFAEEAQ